ncbi:hypothetical protein CJ030_MR2G004215 [Morella rubra]|uniref:GDSL esterase/lipase CPRD49 n=1 Tax=Morella rubra TaxID=262757 RepID=A0A6A1WGM1_9ROSI|nr:hypothetical protein CJ030_MR2G004215 [Morella rubra]
MDVKGIDLWTTLQEKDGWQTACFTDGIHLSAEGSKIVVKEILKVLREADWEPSLHWKSLPTEFEHVLRNYPRHLACNFFEWIDPPFSSRGEDIIASMEEKIKTMEVKIKSMEEEMKIMDEKMKIMEEELHKSKAKQRQLRFIFFGSWMLVGCIWLVCS